MTGVFLCFIILVSQHSRYALSSSEDHNTVARLTRNYDSSLPPLVNGSDSVNIAITFGLKSILELNLKEQTIKTSVWTYLVWKDEVLTWNVSDKIPSHLRVESSKVWTPSVWILNSVKDNGRLIEKDSDVIIHHDGTVAHLSTGIMITQCNINIQRFPFDRQECAIELATYYTVESYQNLTIGTSYVHTGVYTVSDEFNLVSRELRTAHYNITSDQRKNIVQVVLQLERIPTFYILNAILPINFLSVLNTVALLLPEDGGDKMTVCISILLSYAVFMTFISPQLPQNSVVCYFSVYIISLLLISLLICISTIVRIVVKNHTQDKRTCPKDTRSEMSYSSVGNVAMSTSSSKYNYFAFITFLAITLIIHITYFVSMQ